jgi:hypothetical protein
VRGAPTRLSCLARCHSPTNATAPNPPRLALCSKKNTWTQGGSSIVKTETPEFRSTVRRFAAFGTTTNTKSYSKMRNLSTQNLGEQFRYHKGRNDIKERSWR